MTSTSMNMKTAIAGILAAGLVGALPAATVTVDWLQLEAGGSPGGFSLRNDGGDAVAEGTIIVSSGAVFPGMPVGRNFIDEFWRGEIPLVEDSVAADGSVAGFEVRVAPVGGQAGYRLELSVPAGQPLYLMVGELLRTAGAATGGVRIEAYSDEGSAGVELIGILAGSDGAKEYTGALVWDGLTLSTVPESDGESRFAFFGIAPLQGARAKILLSIPESYASGTGDSLVFGLGIGVIPEPSVMLLGGLGMLALLLPRRARGARKP